MRAAVKQNSGSLNGNRMGRKLEARKVKVKWLRGSVRAQFVAGFRRHTAGKSPTEIAKLLEVGEDMARKYLRGDRMPNVDDWGTVAKALGLGHWSELFDRTK